MEEYVLRKLYSNGFRWRGCYANDGHFCLTSYPSLEELLYEIRVLNFQYMVDSHSNHILVLGQHNGTFFELHKEIVGINKYSAIEALLWVYEQRRNM